jgi:hypothetical protein
VTDLPAVVARIAGTWCSWCTWSWKLEWSTVGWELWPSPTVLLLLWTVPPPGLLRPGGVTWLLLLLRTVNHPLALGRSLLLCGGKPLPPLVLIRLAEAGLHFDGGVDEVGEAVIATPQVSPQSGVEPTQETRRSTRLRVHVLREVLGQVDERLDVLQHSLAPLTECTELALLELHQANRDVVGPESLAELRPSHLVTSWLHSHEAGPPSSSGAVKKLGRELCFLLHNEARQKTELGLDGPKLVIRVQRVSCSDED